MRCVRRGLFVYCNRHRVSQQIYPTRKARQYSGEANPFLRFRALLCQRDRDLKLIETKDAAAQCRQGAQMVDVRSASEFRGGHAAGARNIPLEELGSRLEDLDRTGRILLICQSGQRAEIAATRLAAQGIMASVVRGGTVQWKAAGLPLVTVNRVGWSLERQVRFAAGVLVLIASILALTVSYNWLYLAGFVGLGLTMAGLTDFCPMGRLLAAMPWNGTRPNSDTKRMGFDRTPAAQGGPGVEE